MIPTISLVTTCHCTGIDSRGAWADFLECWKYYILHILTVVMDYILYTLKKKKPSSKSTLKMDSLIENKSMPLSSY